MLDYSRKWAQCFLNGPTPASFIVYFGLFKQTSLQLLQQIYVKICPSSIWCQDSNPRPLEHESPPMTTRPKLPPNEVIVRSGSQIYAIRTVFGTVVTFHIGDLPFISRCGKFYEHWIEKIGGRFFGPFLTKNFALLTLKKYVAMQTIIILIKKILLLLCLNGDHSWPVCLSVWPDG